MAAVTTETKDAARIIRYANPPRDYLTAEGCGALLEAVNTAVEDADIRVIIIAGGGEAFIRHYDVAEIIAAGEGVKAGALGPEDFEKGAFADLMSAISGAAKPVIAAINGVCMGGGFELSLACDLRIAGRDVELIGLPETRIDIFPGGGGTQRLPRLIGEARALEFILRGQTVDAETAGQMGLVHHVADDAVALAVEIAAELAARGPEALAIAKRLVRGALGAPLEEGLRAEQHGFHEALKSDRAMAGMQRFLDEGEDITR